MKFKHGERVTCKIIDTEITDAKISVGLAGCYYICQNVKDGFDTQDKLGYRYSWFFNPEAPDREQVTDLKLVDRTIKSHPLLEGDILLGYVDREVSVLGVCGRVVFVSYTGDHTRALTYFTQEELIQAGWKLKQPTPHDTEVREFTLEEVAESLGVPVDKMRIKDRGDK